MKTPDDENLKRLWSQCPCELCEDRRALEAHKAQYKTALWMLSAGVLGLCLVIAAAVLL